MVTGLIVLYNGFARTILTVQLSDTCMRRSGVYHY